MTPVYQSNPRKRRSARPSSNAFLISDSILSETSPNIGTLRSTEPIKHLTERTTALTSLYFKACTTSPDGKTRDVSHITRSRRGMTSTPSLLIPTGRTQDCIPVSSHSPLFHCQYLTRLLFLCKFQSIIRQRNLPSQTDHLHPAQVFRLPLPRIFKRSNVLNVPERRRRDSLPLQSHNPNARLGVHRLSSKAGRQLGPRDSHFRHAHSRRVQFVEFRSQ